MNSIHIVIADDHELFLSGLVELLKKDPLIEIDHTVTDGQALLSHLQEQDAPDIILLDLTMPHVGGLEVLDIVSKQYPFIKCIILSMHDAGHYISACAQKGAYSYLLKNADEEELIHTIYTVSEGKKYFSPAITEKMVNSMAEDQITPQSLSEKQREVLKLIAEGYTTKEIAAQLYISTRTVETHRATIIKKLNVKNTAELIKVAAKSGLV